MKCPFCSHRDSRVIDSRAVEEGCSIRRRRECPNCGKRFTTYEKYEETPLVVSKKDGRRELFDGKKLLAGLLKACEKRPVPYEKIKEIADSIERELRMSADAEIPSAQIGELVMKYLEQTDQIAYVALLPYIVSLPTCVILCRSWSVLCKNLKTQNRGA